jgi:phosphoadenosine phosphosulfate reductase
MIWALKGSVLALPSALAAEYSRVKELHPEMYARWNAFLLEWAKARGLRKSS